MSPRTRTDWNDPRQSLIARSIQAAACWWLGALPGRFTMYSGSLKFASDTTSGA